MSSPTSRSGIRLSAVVLLPVSACSRCSAPSSASPCSPSAPESADEGSTRLGATLAASAFGLLPFAVVMLQLRVFYALTDSRTPTLLQLADRRGEGAAAARRAPLVLPPDWVVLGLAAANASVVRRGCGGRPGRAAPAAGPARHRGRAARRAADGGRRCLRAEPSPSGPCSWSTRRPRSRPGRHVRGSSWVIAAAVGGPAVVGGDAGAAGPGDHDARTRRPAAPVPACRIGVLTPVQNTLGEVRFAVPLTGCEGRHEDPSCRTLGILGPQRHGPGGGRVVIEEST